MTDILELALADSPWPGDWARNGRCQNVPPNVFFPGRGDSPAQAKQICANCPVLEPCREYAIPISRLSGVWGGLTAEERKRARTDLERRPVATSRPPRTQAPAGTLDAHLAQLLAHPGRWARVAVYPSTHSAAAVASVLRNGHRPRPAGRWTFEGRLLGNGEGSALYARFDGPEPAENVA